MKMKPKIENDQIILSDGKPVYVMEDGKEFVADVPSLYQKTLELKGESKRHREAKEIAEGKASFYADLFPEMDMEALKEWKLSADSALDTVKNLEDKKLLDAKKVEIIKNELREAHDKNLASVKRVLPKRSLNIRDRFLGKTNRYSNSW